MCITTTVKRHDIDRQRFYNAHKKLIDKFEKSKFNNAEGRNNAIYELNKRDRQIIQTNDRNINEYYNAEFEKDARKVGTEYAKGYKTLSEFNKRGTTGTQQKSDEIIPQRNVGTNTRNSSPDGRLRTDRGRSSRFESEDSEAQFSFENSRYRDESDEQRIKDKALDKVYQWHGDIGADRFDVDKTLNSFVQTTKGIAKEYSCKIGI